ncbi:MAG TPA: Crp/Fnr family transcriptional regulator [Terriglobales bacterium]|nr:Crp/Fnr family transcriptional regulator [Terriglobales bacterium]
MERRESAHHRRSKSKLLQGSKSQVSAKPVSNLVLRAIPQREYELLEPYLEPFDLRRQQILREPGEKIDFAYFLNSGLCASVVLTTDGRSVEVAVIGKEGVIGSAVAVGLNRSPHRVVVQVPGNCLRIASDVLEQLMPDLPELQRQLGRYVMVRGMQVAQIAACNRLHEIEQRLARWLLMCQDRIDSDWLPVTHEFLAQMLGTGRPSVSLAAGVLQKAGLIENLRGTVKILKRKELENSACECYRVISHYQNAVSKS